MQGTGGSMQGTEPENFFPGAIGDGSVPYGDGAQLLLIGMKEQIASFYA
jgi:hypothetical protein